RILRRMLQSASSSVQDLWIFGFSVSREALLLIRYDGKSIIFRMRDPNFSSITPFESSFVGLKDRILLRLCSNFKCELIMKELEKAENSSFKNVVFRAEKFSIDIDFSDYIF